MRNWLKRMALAAAWKVDRWCHKIIEKLDPMSDEDLHKAMQTFRNSLEARKVAYELDKKS